MKKSAPWTRQHCSNVPPPISRYQNATGVFVYLLWCPVDKVVKYVGCSGHTPKERLLGHVCEARGNTSNHTPKSRWIQSLLALGLYPTLRYIKGFDFYEEAYILEAQLIASVGARRALFNGNKGNVNKAAQFANHFKS